MVNQQVSASHEKLVSHHFLTKESVGDGVRAEEIIVGAGKNLSEQTAGHLTHTLHTRTRAFGF